MVRTLLKWPESETCELLPSKKILEIINATVIAFYFGYTHRTSRCNMFCKGIQVLVEKVNLALKWLDGSNFEPHKVIDVTSFKVKFLFERNIGHAVEYYLHDMKMGL